MANRYETEGKALERRRQIAEALRASGNEPLPASIRTSGAMDAPVSGWAYFDKALKQAMSGYMEGKVNRDEKKLSEEQQNEQRQWIQGLEAGTAPDELRPVRNTNQLMDVPEVQGQDSGAPLQSSINPATGNIEGPPIGGRAPVGLQQQMANAIRGQQQYAQDEAATQASDKQRMVSYALKGIDIGGVPAALGGALAERALLPKEKDDFTLGADEVRFSGGTGKALAQGLPKIAPPGSEDRLLMEIADKNAPGGHRTIKRESWKEGMQEWQKPNQSMILNNAAMGLSDQAKDDAAEYFRVNKKLPPGFTRSPVVSIDIMNRAAERSRALGDDAGAAQMRAAASTAGRAALAQITKQQVMVGAFEKTATKNLNLALDYSEKVDRSGSPIFNKWIIAGKKSVSGDKDVAAFHAANETFINEYAKIMSGSMGNTAVSDAAREHAREIIGPVQTKEQYREVAALLKQEMQNRIVGFEEEVKQLQPVISGTGDSPFGAAGVDEEAEYQAWKEAQGQ